MTFALSPRPTIRTEHRSVTPMHPMMGVLTPRKVTFHHNVAIDNGSSDNDLPLVRHNTQDDLNSGGARIHYTQELALMVES
jgi:hypothetical protein